MINQWKLGDHVKWQTPQGETKGKIVRILRERVHLDGHTFDASADDPRYEVESMKSG